MFTLASLLALCFAALWWFVHNDAAEYRAFKLLRETAARQRRYRAWVLKSFLLFSGATIVSLGILDRLRALTVFPDEFRALSGAVQSCLPQKQLPHAGFLAGFAAAAVAGIAAGALVMKALHRKAAPRWPTPVSAFVRRQRWGF